MCPAIAECVVRTIFVCIGSTVDDFCRESGGVAIAMASGQITLKVTLKQSDEGSVPKLEVEGTLGMLHVLLSPHQLGVLKDMAEGIAAQGT